MTAKDIIEARSMLRHEIDRLKLDAGIGPIAAELISWLRRVAWEVVIAGNEARLRPKKLKDLVELHGVQQVRRWLPTLSALTLGVNPNTMELVLAPKE